MADEDNKEPTGEDTRTLPPIGNVAMSKEQLDTMLRKQDRVILPMGDTVALEPPARAMQAAVPPVGVPLAAMTEQQQAWLQNAVVPRKLPPKCGNMTMREAFAFCERAAERLAESERRGEEHQRIMMHAVDTRDEAHRQNVMLRSKLAVWRGVAIMSATIALGLLALRIWRP